MSEKSKRNVFDKFDAALLTLFSKDDKTINELAKAFNRNGANVSISEFSKIVDSDPLTGEPIYLRGVLANILHNYSHHNETFNKELRTTKLDKKTLHKFQQFIKKLDKNALMGLNLLFEINRNERDGVVSAKSDVILEEIYDENEELIGYLPLLQISMTFTDEENGTKTFKLSTTLDKLSNIIQVLQDMHDKGMMSAKNYKKKLGESVVITK